MFDKTSFLNLIVGFLSPTVILLWFLIRIISFHSTNFYNCLNEQLFATYMKAYLFFFENVGINKIFIYGDVDVLEKDQEKVLYMANHLSTSDWFLVSILLSRQGNIGRSRFLLHKNLKYIPVFGFYLSQAWCIFVDRSNFQEEKAKNVLRQLRQLKTKPWVVIYPEGRRYNPEFKDVIKESQEFAKQNDLKPYIHVLTPRTRGFRLLIDEMHDYLDAVYDTTVIYAEENGCPLDSRIRVPQMTSWFGRRHTLHIMVNRIPMSKIPKEPKRVKSWLMERFRLKDEFLERVQSKFYEPSDPVLMASGQNNTESHESIGQKSARQNDDEVDQHRNWKSDVPFEQTIVELLPPQFTRRVIQLKPLSLIQLIPSVIFFFGITFYWIFGFGWYGPLTFILISLFGTLAGEIYVHYAV